MYNLCKPVYSAIKVNGARKATFMTARAQALRAMDTERTMTMADRPTRSFAFSTERPQHKMAWTYTCTGSVLKDSSTCHPWCRDCSYQRMPQRIPRGPKSSSTSQYTRGIMYREKGWITHKDNCDNSESHDGSSLLNALISPSQSCLSLNDSGLLLLKW